MNDGRVFGRLVVLLRAAWIVGVAVSLQSLACTQGGPAPLRGRSVFDGIPVPGQKSKAFEPGARLGGGREPGVGVDYYPPESERLPRGADGEESNAPSGSSDTDGGICAEPPPEPFITHPPTVVPPASFPWQNRSLVGAKPFDLGWNLRGRGSPQAPSFDDGVGLIRAALGSTPIGAGARGNGAALVFGGGGTVGVASGAFVHPVTLVSLPCSVPDMGLTLNLLYMGNALSFANPFTPFGPCFHMSGLDIVIELTTGHSAGQDPAAKIALHRGDGQSAPYVHGTGGYTSGPGVFDTMVWGIVTSGAAPEYGYIRTMRDGRKTYYRRFQQSAQYLRDRLVDTYGNSILYQYQAQGSAAELAAITDTRGVTVAFTWSTVGSFRRITKASIDPTTVAPLSPPAATADLEIEFGYHTSTGLLRRVAWFPTTVVRDQQPSDGRIDLATEVVTGVRPATRFEYGEHGLMTEVWDDTFIEAPVLRLQNVYEWLVSENEWRITRQAEGVANSADPQHVFEYPTQFPQRRIYTDPIGTAATFELDSQDRATSVKLEPTRKPRTLEGAVLPDHDSLTWGIVYGCAGCGLPSQIYTPRSTAAVGPRPPFEFTWNLGTGRPTMIKGNVTYRFAYDARARVTRAWYEVPAGWNATDLFDYTITYVDDVAGRTTEIKSRRTNHAGGFTYQDARQQTLTAPECSLSLDVNTGLVTSVTGADGVTVTHSYVSALPRLVTTGSGVASVTNRFVYDGLGRLVEVEQGLGSGRTVTYVCDLHFRVTRSQTPPVGVGSPAPIVAEGYYDARSNFTVERRENRDETGALRPGARPWVQSDLLHDKHDRPVRENRDGARLDAAQPEWLTRTATFEANHALATVTFPNGATTRYVQDGYGLLYKTLYDDGGLNVLGTRWFYDADGGYIKAVDALNNATDCTRNDKGYLVRVDDPAGRGYTEYEWDAWGRPRLVSRKKTGGEVVTRVETFFSKVGEPFSVTVRGGASPGPNDTITTLYVYNAGGQLLEVARQENSSDTSATTGFRRGTVYTYDVLGRVLTERDKTSDTASLCNETAFVYATGTGLLEAMTHRVFEGALFEAAVTQGTSKTYAETFAYDLMGRLTTATRYPSGGVHPPRTHTWYYDSLHGESRWVDSQGYSVAWLQDPLGRSRKRVEKGQGTSQDTITTTRDFSIGASETIEVETDELGRTTRTVFDKAGRLLREEFPGYGSGSFANSRQYQYQGASTRLFRMTEGHGAVIEYAYDAAGRILYRRLLNPTPGGPLSLMATGEAFGYDTAGRLTSSTTVFGSGYSNLVTVSQDIDGLGRATFDLFHIFAHVGRVVTFGHDHHDLTGIGYPSTSFVAGVSRESDRWGRPWKFKWEQGVGGFKTLAQVRFRRGAFAEKQHFWAAGASDHLATTTTVDDWGYLQRMTTWNGQQAVQDYEYTFDSEGSLLKQKFQRAGQPGSRVGDLYKLDAFYRLEGAKLGVDTAGFVAGFDQAGVFASHFEFGLDDNHNRTQVTLTDGNGTFSTAYTVQPGSHRYTTVGGVNFLYDQNGNLGWDGKYVYIYDFRNRLSEVYQYVAAPTESPASTSGVFAGQTRYNVVSLESVRNLRVPALRKWLSEHGVEEGYEDDVGAMALASEGTAPVGDLQLVAAYGYDPMNRRIVRALQGQPTLYSTWSGFREIDEATHDGAGYQSERQFVWGNRVDELLLYAARNPQTNQWSAYYPAHDHLDSVKKVYQATANGPSLVEQYEYDCHGKVSIFDAAGNPRVASVIGMPYAFTGRRLDPETGLYYQRSRYYSAELGRFMSVDPLGVFGDTAHYGNPYTYGGNSPLDGIDPTGEWFWAVIGGLVNAAIDTAIAVAEGKSAGEVLGTAARSFVEGVVTTATGVGAAKLVSKVGKVAGLADDAVKVAAEIAEEVAGEAVGGLGAEVLDSGPDPIGAGAEDVELPDAPGAETCPGNGCFVAGTLVVTPGGLVPIEQIDVGDSVVTATAGEEQSSETEVDPETWRKVTLRLANVEGGVLQITALRSPEWVAATGCRQGEQIWLEFPDMAAKGWALVDAVEPCPALGKGAGRVVLTTFSQINNAVLRLWLDGPTEVVEATEGHPFWSETHGGWRHAYELVAGEKLRARAGSVTLLRVEAVAGVFRIHNFEVEAEHVYQVAVPGVLSHNPGGRRTSALGPNGGRRSDADQRRINEQREARAERRERDSREKNGQNPSGEGYRNLEDSDKGSRGQRPTREGGANRERNRGIDEEHSVRAKGSGGDPCRGRR